MHYANKIEKAPASAKQTLQDNTAFTAPENIQLTTARKITLLSFLLSLLLLIWGVTQWEWYINEIAALFFGLGLLAALINRIPLNHTMSAFTDGAREMLTAGLVIALSKGILLLATEGKIIDTVLYYISGSVEGLPKALSIQMMFLVQSFLNLFLPSGSGQAALTMPIMTPLSDLLGITRQTAVLAFQFGDGISNLIIPTSGVTMGVLAIAKIPYERWVKWAGPLIIILFILAMLLLIPPVVFFHYGPF